MSEPEQDPRARFRQLPEPVRPDDVVETSDVTRPVVTETPLEREWRVSLLGPGAP